MTGPDRFLDAKLGLAMLTGLVLPSPHAPDDYTALNLSSPTGLSNIISDPTWAGKPISKEELFTPVVKNGTVELPIADIQDATKFSPIWDLKGAAWAKSPDKIIGSLFASVRGLKTPLLTANNTTSGTEPATAATKYFVITPDMQNLKFGLAGSGITNAHASLAIDGQMMNRDGAASVNAVSNISWDLSKYVGKSAQVTLRCSPGGWLGVGYADNTIPIPAALPKLPEISAEFRNKAFYDDESLAIPTRKELINQLSNSALNAQLAARNVDGYTVTGLPTKMSLFDRDMVSLLKENGIPGASVALAYKGKLIFARGYGKTSTTSGTPVEPTTPGNILSVTKPLTVMAALKLANSGLLNLDEPVSKFLSIDPLIKPGESADRRLSNITVRMLMNHTSGMNNAVEELNDQNFFKSLIPDGKVKLNNGRPFQIDISRRSLAMPLIADPGTAYNYSGQAMQLLGRIVERCSGQRLDKFIRENICQPLGIKSYYVNTYLNNNDYEAYFKSDRTNYYAFCPSPYDKSLGMCLSREIPAPLASWGEADACGTAFMNVVDLCRLVTSVPSLYKPNIRDQISVRGTVLPSYNDPNAGKMPIKNPYGLGWGIIDQPNHNIDIWHFGVGWGCRAYASNLANGYSFALIINGDGKDQSGIDKIIKMPQIFLQQYADDNSSYPTWTDYGFTK